MKPVTDNAPLQQLEEWDDFVATRYRQDKSEEEFRNYKADANPTVTEFYRQNHARQTLDFVRNKKAEYSGLKRCTGMVIRAGSYSPALCTILEKCSACMASRSGPLWAIPSLSAAHTRIRSFFRNSLPPIPIARFPSTKPSMASTNRTAASIRFISRSDTTSTSIRQREGICRKRRSTCSGIIPFMPRTGTALTAI